MNDFLAQLQYLGEQNPDKFSIVDGEGALTFNGLLACVQSKVTKLKAYHSGSGQVYGVIDNKNIETVINLFAILCLQGVYVPIRQDLPNIKLEEMIKSSEMSVLIDDKVIQCFAVRASNSCLDSGYMMYTSGTTGCPKGVHITYQKIKWLISALRSRIPYEQQVVGVNGPLSFDTSVKQLFQVMHGNTVVLIPEKIKLNTEKLKAFICKNQITLIDMTPSLWRLHQVSAPLKHILLGGEGISIDTWSEIKKVMKTSSIKFYNLYGPTETTVDATVSLLHLDMAAPTIGQPLPGVRIKINKGEIFIHSPGVFSGYYNNAKATNEKMFVEDNKAWYASGDRGEWVSFQGAKHLIHKGRIDRQVKIQGYRIELDEISACLNICEGILQSYVVCQNKQLIVYYRGHVSVPDVKKHLERHLESYKIPKHFICVESFPLNKNGKICSDQLKKRHLCGALSKNETLTELDKQSALVNIVKSVLSVKAITACDNFFSLGGDSISAMLLINDLRKHGLSLKIQDVYSASTISDLAKHIESRRKVSLPTCSDKFLPLLPIHHRFFEMVRSDRHHWNQSVLLRLKSATINQGKLEKAIAVLLDNHPVFKLKVGLCNQLEFSSHDPQSPVLQVFKSFDQQIIYKLQSEFDLEKGHLYQFALFQKEKLFFATFHHLLCDGITLRLIVDKLFDYYYQSTMVMEVHAYKEWSELLTSTEVKISAWYKKYLSQAPTYSFSQKNADMTENHMSCRKVVLSQEQSSLIFKATSDCLKSGINPVLLYNLSTALAQSVGSGWVWVDMESHGRCPRVSLDVSSTLGWFTSIYPVYLNCDRKFSLVSLLSLVADMENMRPYHATFGVLKYIKKKVPITQTKNNHPIKFNFLGHFSSPHKDVEFIAHDHAQDISPHAESPYALEVEMYVYDQRLCMNFKWNKHVFSLATIQALMDHYQQSLINSCQYLHDTNLGIEHVLTPTPITHRMLDQSIKGAYIEQFLFKLNTRVSFAQVKAAWQKIVKQHDALRCAFYRRKSGGFIQVIYEEVDVLFQEVSFQLRSQLDQFLLADRKIGFSDVALQKGVSRICLIKCAGHSYFLWSHHHAVLDGASFNKIIGDWLSLLAGEELAPRHRGYVDYIRDVVHLEDDDFREIEHVATTEIKAANYQTITHHESWVPLADEEIAQLVDYVRLKQCTLNHIFQMVLAMAYHQTFEKKATVCLGSVMSCRSGIGQLHSHHALSDLVGNTLSILPLKIPCLAENDSMAKVDKTLEQIRQDNVDLNDYVHRDVEKNLGINTDETIYDLVLFFDNLKNNQYQERLSQYFCGFEAFEQVHYPLSVIINAHDQTSLGVEYCSLHFSKEQINSFLKNIKSSLRRIIKLINGGVHEVSSH